MTSKESVRTVKSLKRLTAQARDGAYGTQRSKGTMYQNLYLSNADSQKPDTFWIIPR